MVDGLLKSPLEGVLVRMYSFCLVKSAPLVRVAAVNRKIHETTAVREQMKKPYFSEIQV